MRLVDADISDVVVSEIERDSVGATAGNHPEVSVSEQRSLGKVRGKRTSHKKVWIFLVGTGVPDSTLGHNCSAENK